MACEYFIGDRKFTEQEFKQFLAEEGLDQFLNEKSIDLNKIPPSSPPVKIDSAEKPIRFENKSILKRMVESENINPETKKKFEQSLKYEVKSKEEARVIAKDVIKEYGLDNAVSLAEANKFHGDVNAMIFNEALDSVYFAERDAKTPQEKTEMAAKWADISTRYDESARSQGRFISAIADFYKTSPLGFKIKEEANRNESFKKWFKSKETDYKDVFEAIKEEPEFKEIIKKEVSEQLKKERGESRAKTRKKIEDFFESAKFKKDATYATIIPPDVINGGLEVMKKAFLAGESVVNAVDMAIEHISTKVKDWDKEKFRKEYEEKLKSIDPNAKKTQEELTEEKKQRILERFRKKLKGLSEREKEDVIRKSFKKLVESGALEYDDFKKIIADTIGLGELNEAQRDKIDQYVKDINDVQDKAEKAREQRTEESLKAYEVAAKKSEKSATELANIVYSKPQLVNRFVSIMQLNTLGIPSLVNNPIFNIVNQAFVRFPKAVQLSVLDQLIKGGGKIFGKDYQPQTNVVTSQLPFWQGMVKGSKQSMEQLFTGLTNKDYFQKEVKAAQIHPFTSQKELWDYAKSTKFGERVLKPLGFEKGTGKRLSGEQLVDKSMQATIGFPAELVARMLNIGDKPQRFAAEQAEAKVIANNYGLKGMDEKIFLSFPKEEAYRMERAKGKSEEEAMRIAQQVERSIVSAGEESTFQQDNLINDMISAVGKAYDNMANKEDGNVVLQSMGNVGKVVRTMNMPFIKIPLNAYWSYFNLVNPEIAMAQSFIYGSSAAYKKIKGIDGASADFEKSKKWLAHATTGMAMLGLTGYLAKQGIIRGDNDDEDTKKEREGEKAFEQQHTIELWGLNVDLKYLGVLGNAMNLQANKIEQMTPEQRKNGMTLMEDIGYNLKTSALEQFDNGVFGNASSLMSAMHNGGSFWDAYALGQINMVTNAIQPAMFAQLSRAQMPNDYTTKADTFWEQIKNNAAARSSLVRKLTGINPPSKIGIWGDVVKRENDFDDVMLRWFGMSKVNKDNFAQPIYEDYKKTGNVAFFPPSVKPEIDKQKLNTEQSTKLSILVGQERKKRIAPYVNDMATLPGFGKKYSKLSETEKLKALSIIYDKGFESAKDKFYTLYPQFKKQKSSAEKQNKSQESYKSRVFSRSVK